MTIHIWEAGQCPSSSLTSAFVGSVYFIFSNDHSHLRGGSMPNFSVALLPRECGAHYWSPSWGFVRGTTGHVLGKRAISSLMVNLGYRVFLNWIRDGRFLKYLIFKYFYLTNIYWYHIYYQIFKFFLKKFWIYSYFTCEKYLVPTFRISRIFRSPTLLDQGFSYWEKLKSGKCSNWWIAMSNLITLRNKFYIWGRSELKILSLNFGLQKFLRI